MVRNKILEGTDSNFDDEVKRSTIPVVVDFWAPWCGPCKSISPILEEMAEKFSGKVKFVSVNVDDNKNKPSEYAVRSIPTLLFFKGGKIENQLIGAQSKENIERAIEQLL